MMSWSKGGNFMQRKKENKDKLETKLKNNKKGQNMINY